MAKILFIGDSIMHGIYQRASPIVAGGYHTMVHVCLAADVILDQLAEWQASVYYDLTGPTAPTVVYIMVGTNDIISTADSTAQILAEYETLVDSVLAHKDPSAVVWVGKITPAKIKYGVGLNYEQWIDVNTGLQALAATKGVLWKPEVSDALNDGFDDLLPQYAYSDGWHLKDPAGNVFAASVLAGMLDAYDPPPPPPVVPTRPALAVDRRFR